MGSNGVVERDFYIGEPGTKIMAGQVLPDGHIILSGSTLNKEGREAGFVCKVSPRNKVVYFYTAVTGAVCRHFDVLGNRSELLHAAFTDGKGRQLGGAPRRKRQALFPHDAARRELPHRADGLDRRR